MCTYKNALKFEVFVCLTLTDIKKKLNKASNETVHCNAYLIVADISVSVCIMLNFFFSRFSLLPLEMAALL